MKEVIFLLFFLSFNHADPRGKPYERDIVCQQFNLLGKENFAALTVIMNSRKYSNATFEEINNIVKAIASLTEKCCVEGAAANCYDNEASALSEKSCDPRSPFPKHPGVTSCCVHKGLERKLCLADLKQPPKEFPTYVEPSNEELCTAFKTNPKLFSFKFLYEYCSNYAQAPFLVVKNATENYINMIVECCTAKKPTPCFLKQVSDSSNTEGRIKITALEPTPSKGNQQWRLQYFLMRLQMHPLHLLTVMSNRLCSRFASYGEQKLKLSAAVMFSQKIPSAEFKDVMPIVEQGTQGLAKCCRSLTDNCIENELSVNVKQVCKKLSRDTRVSECCKKAPIDTLHCLHSMSAAESIKLPKLQFPNADQLCKKGKNQGLEKYMFEIARRNTKLPEVFVEKLYEPVAEIVKKCCSSENANSCLDKKKSQLNNEIKNYISEGNELCGDFHKYPFSEFKQRLIKALGRRVPKPAANKVEELAEERANLASTCCIINAPPVYCKEKINLIITNNCADGACLLQ